MLRNPDLDRDQLARHLELQPELVAAAVDDLLRVGLVARAGAGLALASPATTLAALVHVELSDLEERRSRLDAVRASLSGFAADHMVGQSRAWSSMPFELLSMDESFAAVEDIQRGTTGEVLSCHPAVNIEVDAPTYVDLLTHQLAEGRPMRGLYPTDVLGDPARLAYVRQWSDAGEDVRLMSQTLPAIAVFGDRDRAGVLGLGRRVGGHPAGPGPGPGGAGARAVRPVLDPRHPAAGPHHAPGSGHPRRRRPRRARPAPARPQGREHRPAPRHLAAHRTAADRGPDGRPRCDHTFPGGYGGCTTRPAECRPHRKDRPSDRPGRHAPPPPRGGDRHAVHRGQLASRCCATATRSSRPCSTRSAAPRPPST